LLGGALARFMTVGMVLGGASVIVLLVGILALLVRSRQPARAQRRGAAGPMDEDEGLEDEQMGGAEALDDQMGEDEPEQAEYAPPPRAPSQQFGRLRGSQFIQPEEDGAGDQAYEQDGTGEEQDWEQPQQAPQTPFPRGRTRSRAAPWEQGSGAGRGLGLRSRFGQEEQEE
jgi:hypothetical protein